MFFACGKLWRSICGLSHTSRSYGSHYINYDDIFFRLYYRFTCTILLLVSVIIVLREWSIDSVDCNIPASVIGEVTGVGGEISYYRLNAYCKMHNRFIPLGSPQSQQCSVNASSHQAHQTPSPTAPHIQTIPKYQWFSLILFCASILIYLPHLLWKCSNRSMIKSVVVGRFRRRRSSHRFSLDQLIKISLQSSQIGGHQCLFATFYIVLKLLNLAILVGLIFFTNLLLNLQFLQYPLYFFDKIQNTASVRSSLVDQTNQIPNCTNELPAATIGPLPFFRPFEDIFPKSSLCPYTYLDSKTSQSKTVLVSCLMPINSLLEQIFLFLWFWYAILLIFTVIDFTRYLALFLFRHLRVVLLKYNTNNILLDATYSKCGESFSSWLFTTIVLINNQGNGTYVGRGDSGKGKNLEVIEEEGDEDEASDALYESIEMNVVRNSAGSRACDSSRANQGSRRTNV